MTRMLHLTSLVIRLLQAVYCHRAIYAGLALCHGTECLTTGKTALYGPMALLYLLLALKK